MSMNPEQEKFEDLRRLLALKRHEQPPPGYFQDFSHQVITRIKVGERLDSDTFFERLLGQAPWLQRLWNGFEAKPIVAGAFGVGVCSLLVVGLISSERIDSSAGVLPLSAGPSLATVQSQPVNSLFDQPATGLASTGSIYTAQSRSSIFEEIRKPHVQAVNFSTSAPAN
jgi:hypothetical protein